MRAINRPARLRRAAFFAQFARQGFRDAKRALVTISPDPGFKESSARQCAHQLLTRIYQDPTMAQQIAEIMSPEEVKSLFSTFARDESKPDQTRLRAGELMAKVHALLTERNINENTNRQVPLRAIEGLSTEDLADELVNRLRLSSSGISPQVIDIKQDAGV